MRRPNVKGGDLADLADHDPRRRAALPEFSQGSIEEETSQKKPQKYLTDSASENVVLGIEREIVPLARAVALSRTFPVPFELSLISSPLRPVWSRLRGRQTGVL